MGVVMLAETTLTTTTSPISTTCVLRTTPSVRRTSGTSRWSTWTPRAPLRSIPTGSFAIKAKSWCRRPTPTLASLLVSLRIRTAPCGSCLQGAHGAHGRPFKTEWTGAVGLSGSPHPPLVCKTICLNIFNGRTWGSTYLPLQILCDLIFSKPFRFMDLVCKLLPRVVKLCHNSVSGI